MRYFKFVITILVAVILTGGKVEAQTPEYTASPSSDIRPSLGVDEAGLGVSCEELKILSGDNKLVPAQVTFRTEARGDELVYRYHFGDGVIEDGGEEMGHKYTQPGSYQVYVEVRSRGGEWATSEACRTEVKVRSVPLVAHRSACDELVIVEGQDEQAPATVVFEVVGSDNKGKIQGYRLHVGDEEVMEQTDSGRFTHTFVEHGTYEVGAEVRDSEGNWVGSSRSCNVEVRVQAEEVMSKQPETGAPTWVVLAGIAALSMGVLVRRFAVERLAR